jgi:hypothetical protein
MLLAKTVVDNTASFDWELPPGFARFRIEVEAYRPAVDQGDVGFEVSTDGGSNFATTSYINVILWAVTNSHGGGGGTQTRMFLCPFGQANDSGAQTIIATLYGAEAGLYPRVLAHGVGRNTNGTITLGDSVSEYNGSTDRVTHIRMKATSGNMTSGTFYLYGER